MVFRRLLICLILFSSSFFLTPSSLAATKIVLPCYCFCSGKDGTFPINKEGAEISSKAGSANITSADVIYPDKCEAFCQTKHKATVAACAQKFEQFPTNNRLCFTEKQCALENAKGEPMGEWDGKKGSKFQPAECMKGMFYCYPHAEKAQAKLSVPIGNLKMTGELGQYVSVLYQWMLGASAVIAVVMTLIGGLQYVTAGATGKVEEAKTRIKNGVIGLVILLCVVLIMTVVNPQLLKMEVPRLPLIRTLELGGDKSCESYIADDYEVVSQDKDGGKICGNMGLVKSKNGKEVVAGTVCQYKYCSNEGHTSYQEDTYCLGFGKKAQCVRCEDVDESAISKFGIAASDSVCKQLSPGWNTELTFNDGSKGYRRCGFTKDSDLIPGYQFKVLRKGICAYIPIDCKDIKKCADYETEVQVTGAAGKWQPLEDVNNVSSFEFGTGDVSCGLKGCGNFDLDMICDEDPCHVNDHCFYSRGIAGVKDNCKGYSELKK